MTPDSFPITLAAACCNADWAWTEIYDAHAPRVLQYLRMQGVDDAENVLGEVFLRVVRGIHQFSGDEDAFRGWLFRIAQRAVIDSRSAAERHRASDSAEVNSAADAADLVQFSDDEARAYRALRVLPHDQRAVVFFRVVLDLPIAEVARVLGRRESAVKMLQQRAFATLRDRLVAKSAAQPTVTREQS